MSTNVRGKRPLQPRTSSDAGDGGGVIGGDGISGDGGGPAPDWLSWLLRASGDGSTLDTPNGGDSGSPGGGANPDGAGRIPLPAPGDVSRVGMPIFPGSGYFQRGPGGDGGIIVPPRPPDQVIAIKNISPDAGYPLYLTIDAAGNVGAAFTGKLSAQGIDFPSATVVAAPPQSKIRWLRQSDGASVAEIYTVEDSPLTGQRSLFETVLAPDIAGAPGSRVLLAAKSRLGGDSSLTVTGSNQAETAAGSVQIAAATAGGGALSRTLLDGNGSGHALLSPKTAAGGYTPDQQIPQARMSAAAASIATGTETSFNMTTTDFDNDGMANLATDLLTVQHAGLYLVLVGTSWAANGTGSRVSVVFKNGALYDRQVGATYSATTTTQVVCAAIMRCAVGDTLLARGEQNSGAALSASAHIEAVWLSG